MVFCSSLILFSLIFLSTGYLSYDSLTIALVSFWYLPYESLPPFFYGSLEISSVLCRTLVFSDTLPCGIPVVFLWFLYGVLWLSSIVYSLVWCTLSPGTALKFWFGYLCIPRHYFIPYRNDVYPARLFHRQSIS